MAKKTILTDHYNNEKAELEYLKSKPACFLVIGKPCSGKTTIANFLSSYWEAPLINGENIINELLKSKPKTKDVFIMEEMLIRGEMLSSTLVFDQMLKKLSSPDVMNRGYVLDDFPNVETNIMSIKYQFDTLNKLNLTPDFLIYIKMPHDDMVMRASNLRIDPLTKELVNLNELKLQQLVIFAKNEENNKIAADTLQLKRKTKKEAKKSYVILPEMEKFNFKQNLVEFNCNFLPRLENYIDHFNHQKVIELDGNMPIDKLIADLKERLHYFRIQPAITPVRLNVEAVEAELEQDRIAEEERLQLIIAKRKAHTQEMLARLEAAKRRMEEEEEQQEEEENNSREDGKESVSAESIASLTGSAVEKTASLEGSKEEEEVEQQQQQQQINPYYREEECCPEETILPENKNKKKRKQKTNKDNTTIDDEEENDIQQEMDFLEDEQMELINLDLEPVETLDEEEYFRMFTNLHAISSKFKWQRSRWKSYCPVALTKGKLIKGRPEFAIGYLGKLYALSTKQAANAFMENPRPYLLDPNPKIPCRIFITGPPKSGKTSLATKLASKYLATVIDMSVAILPTLNLEKERARQKLTEEVIEEAVPEIRAFRVKIMLDSLQEQRQIKRLVADLMKRQDRTMEIMIAGTLNSTSETVENEQATIEITEPSIIGENKKTNTESSKTQVTAKTSKTVDLPKSGPMKKKLGKKGKKLEEIAWAPSIETLYDDKPVAYSEISSEDMDQESKEREELIRLAELKLDEEKANEIEVENDDPEVLKRVEEALLNSGIDEMFLDPEAVACVLLDEVIIAEQNLKRFDPNGPERGGWIIDNFPANSEEHWAEIVKIQRLIPDDVIRLVDTSENYTHLVHLWYNENMSSLNYRIVDRLKVDMLENIKRKREEETEIKREKVKEERNRERIAQREQQRKFYLMEEQEVQQEDQDQLEEQQEEEKQQQPQLPQLQLHKQYDEELVGNEGQTDVADFPIMFRQVNDKDSSPNKSQNANSEYYEMGDDNVDTMDNDDEEEEQDEDEEKPVILEEDLLDDRQKAEIDLAQLNKDANQAFKFLFSKMPEGPELDEHLDIIHNWEDKWEDAAAFLSSHKVSILNLMIGRTVEKTIIPEKSTESSGQEEVEEVKEKLVEHILKDKIDIFEEAQYYITRYFRHMAHEKTYEDDIVDDNIVPDVHDEAEDDEVDSIKIEIEEREILNPGSSLTEPLGDYRIYCPVAYVEKHINWPGNPDISAIYKAKIYWFSDEESRDKFLAKPEEYFYADKPPVPVALRLIILGPNGGGKKANGRLLSERYNCYFIQFLDRLQEMIIAKTKANILQENQNNFDNAILLEEIKELEKIPTQEHSDIVPLIKSDFDFEEGELMPQQEKEETTDDISPLTEVEEAIVAYLKDQVPLPKDVLAEILNEWWFKEPYKSKGFVLLDFPNNAEEVALMSELGYYPDAILIFNVSLNNVTNQLITDCMRVWHEQKMQRDRLVDLVKDLQSKKRFDLMTKRRNELLLEKQDETEFDEDKEKSNPVDDYIDETIKQEFPEEDFLYSETGVETELEAIVRFTNEIHQKYENEVSNLQNLTEMLQNLKVPVHEIDSNRKAAIVDFHMKQHMKPIVDHRLSIYESVYSITPEVARALIKLGHMFISKFNMWDPVELKKGTFLPPEYDSPMFPAIHRKYIYYMSSAKNRSLFITDPISYLCQSDPMPITPIRLAIIGPPLSGKSTVAKRLSKEYSVIRISNGEAVRKILKEQANTVLAEQILDLLYAGRPVPDALVSRCIEVILMNAKCKTRGYVLDGYPMTMDQIMLLEQRNIIPFRVLHLDLDFKLATDRWALSLLIKRPYVFNNTSEEFLFRLDKHAEHFPTTVNFYTVEHENVVKVDANRSVWSVWRVAETVSKEAVRTVQQYVYNRALSNAAKVSGMCITPKEFKNRLGDYRNFCPVSWADRNELIDCSKQTSIQFAAEYKGRYYRFHSDAELQKFLLNADFYFFPFMRTPIPNEEDIPLRVTTDEARAMFPTPVQLRGYCPVTYLMGDFRFESIVTGNPELVVLYRKNLYYFDSEEKLEMFMRQPFKYCDLKLPSKLPPKPLPLKVSNLPNLGFMEQSVVDAVSSALHAVGRLKPKYPFMNAHKSALIYVALHLKAYNPKNTGYSRHKYKCKLRDFEESCDLLPYIVMNMGRKFSQTLRRPLGFNDKFEKFFNLKTEHIQW